MRVSEFAESAPLTWPRIAPFAQRSVGTLATAVTMPSLGAAEKPAIDNPESDRIHDAGTFDNVTHPPEHRIRAL
jgi:hypothetical protein